MKKALFIFGLIASVGLGVYLLSNSMQKSQAVTGKISVVTTLFSQYDFAKVIGGDHVEVTLLLPPGVEAHAYEPKPSDITKINNARVFVYTGASMEPWAQDIIEGVDKKIKIVDASNGVVLMKGEEGTEHEAEHEAEHHHDGVDPHIWLDFDNAKIMSENIAKALMEVDPRNAEYYQTNVKLFQLKLTELDTTYRKTLSACSSKSIIYGGHYAFGYLAKRFGLEYVSAQGFIPNDEPTAKDMIDLVDQIKKDSIQYIFYEELTSSKIAETLAKETNTKLLLLNGAHNLSRDDFESGKSYISLMEDNLKNLAIGLECQNN